MSKIVQEARRVAREVLEQYEPVIGLEVHVQLKTETKIFCACSTRFGDPPNTNVCPVCLGLPGSLPVLNRRALEMAVRAALALQCTVHARSRFARKNYFYPDLPKGYQISMYELPLASAGRLEIDPAGDVGAPKHIGITRLHMEEDAAKAMHEGFPDSDRNSYIDYNRCGVPLIEIVSEPDLRSPADAYTYLNTLKQVLQYTAVSDCNMEEGSLRCDANVSVRRRGAEKLGVKTEVKNLNSFRYLQRALEFEIERHIGALESSGQIEQETRLWNLAAGRTEPMRSKEFAHDYRYFPDPDLLPVHVGEAWKAKIVETMPELPAARRARFLRDYALTPYEAGVLTDTHALADYFEATTKLAGDPKKAANVIANWVLAKVKDEGISLEEWADRIPPAQLARVLALMSTQVPVSGISISAATARAVIGKMAETRRTVDDIIAAEGLAQISDAGEIERLCREVIAQNPDNVAKYRAGNEGVFKFFVGQVMRASRGQANPQQVNDALKRLLD
jgi:aspartyl-tRNA(Asn)/glutamyl-tRNA(Gln) amidotransferase subunit B